ncbi:hypothetical protein RXP87_29840, partial [Pseudomonas aeruginosa]|nr:hypothetical protein [Pseudomonas aeruginosa]
YMTGGRVLILGATGRNFAAGMSGGEAYVLDLDADLVNRELVEVTGLRAEDEDVVKELLTKHAAETGSSVAESLLNDWPSSLVRFSLVTPREYQRVLSIRKDAEGMGVDPDSAQVWDKIMEVS